MVYGIPKKPTLSIGRKKDDGSYSKVENRRLVKKKKSTSMGTKRQQGYVPEGPSNRSGPGGKKATERKKLQPVPLPKMPPKPGGKKGELPKLGPTPSPTPTQYGSNGAKLLGFKKNSSKALGSSVTSDKKKAQLKALQEQAKKAQQKKKNQIKTLTSKTVKAKKNNSSTRKGQR